MSDEEFEVVGSFIDFHAFCNKQKAYFERVSENKRILYQGLEGIDDKDTFCDSAFENAVTVFKAAGLPLNLSDENRNFLSNLRGGKGDRNKCAALHFHLMSKYPRRGSIINSRIFDTPLIDGLFLQKVEAHSKPHEVDDKKDERRSAADLFNSRLGSTDRINPNTAGEKYDFDLNDLIFVLKCATQAREIEDVIETALKSALNAESIANKIVFYTKNSIIRNFCRLYFRNFNSKIKFLLKSYVSEVEKIQDLSIDIYSKSVKDVLMIDGVFRKCPLLREEIQDDFPIGALGSGSGDFLIEYRRIQQTQLTIVNGKNISINENDLIVKLTKARKVLIDSYFESLNLLSKCPEWENLLHQSFSRTVTSFDSFDQAIDRYHSFRDMQVAINGGEIDNNMMLELTKCIRVCMKIPTKNLRDAKNKVTVNLKGEPRWTNY